MSEHGGWVCGATPRTLGVQRAGGLMGGALRQPAGPRPHPAGPLCVRSLSLLTEAWPSRGEGGRTERSRTTCTWDSGRTLRPERTPGRPAGPGFVGPGSLPWAGLAQPPGDALSWPPWCPGPQIRSHGLSACKQAAGTGACLGLGSRLLALAALRGQLNAHSLPPRWPEVCG